MLIVNYILSIFSKLYKSLKFNGVWYIPRRSNASCSNFGYNIYSDASHFNFGESKFLWFFQMVIFFREYDKRNYVFK